MCFQKRLIKYIQHDKKLSYKRLLIILIILLILAVTAYEVLKVVDINSPLYFLKNGVVSILIDLGLKEKVDITPILKTEFVIEEFISGLEQPTTMAFVNNDILVLEKKKGTVRLIRDGVLEKDPVLDVEVAWIQETGMLGILADDAKIYLYYTESEIDGGIPIRNVIYKYQWDGKKLTNPELLNVLPVHTFNHVGGVFAKGLDGTIFAVTGDQTLTGESCEAIKLYKANPEIPCRIQGENNGLFHNVEGGEIDDTAMIFRVGIDPNEPRPMKSSKQMEHYYAIGIRNSFGLAVDPFTGNLWATEAGPKDFDEINLITPKFNSGWKKIMGPSTEEQRNSLPIFEEFHYEDPKFSWEQSVTPTAIEFINSTKFVNFKDYVLVADCYGYGTGHIFMFKLNSNRDGFVFTDSHLQDLIVNQKKTEDGKLISESMEEIIISSGMGCVSDMEFGPDGYLYIVELFNGKIFKLMPK